VGDHEVDLDGVCMPIMDSFRCRYDTVRRSSAGTARWLSARTRRLPSRRTRGDDLESPMEVPVSVGDHEVDLDGVCLPMMDFSGADTIP